MSKKFKGYQLIGYKCVSPGCKHREIYTDSKNGCPECGGLGRELIYAYGE